MSIQSYSDLMDQIEPYVMGCPIPVILQRLQLVGRDFCRETERMTETLWIDTVIDQREYDLTPSIDTLSIRRVLRVDLLTEEDVLNDLDGSTLGRGYYEVQKTDGVTVELQLRDVIKPKANIENGIKVAVMPVTTSCTSAAYMRSQWSTSRRIRSVTRFRRNTPCPSTKPAGGPPT